MDKMTYCSPVTEVIATDLVDSLLEWSNQTINGNPTGDFNYGGEASDDMEADAKKAQWLDNWDKMGSWDD